ncbi:putative bifunctional diguanylate cyclase/phosphodiesterase [Thiomicrorhabdus aquaedulcis]|uniref:putative bifunctional diguanylate cyclase/phosphodiesterase n=1 Tax=Thiomicrorhabdus aquaedulcis TaxID=2211106 RepID=UPI000FDB48C7|nr:GGDEF domain-containing phosphodiesterase [Thiomicrorhabdus aquaedulcis]
MRAGRTLLFLTFWPVLLLALFTLSIAYWSLSSIKNHSIDLHKKQLHDLNIVQEAAEFSQEIGQVHQKVSDAIANAKLKKLSEIQLYTLHTQVVDELEALTERVNLLVQSDLLQEVNHGNVLPLQQEFQAYRQFIIMATDIIAIDTGVAQDYVQKAQQNFVQFSLYIQRITHLLAQRTEVRNSQEFATQEQFLYGIVGASLAGLAMILALVVFFSGFISRKILYIADALSAMAHGSTHAQIEMLNIKKMHADDNGEFGRIAGALLNFHEAIERRKEAEAEAFQLAFYDPLTKLPNRRLLIERLEYSMSLNHLSGQFGGVLLFDLDDFKVINDSQGHQAGDQLLLELAGRLTKLAKGDNHIARVGGDEFVWTLESLGLEKTHAATKAEQLAEALRETLNQPYEINEVRYFSTPSIGIVLFNGTNEPVDELLKQAETAMYNAKSNGRNCLSFYDPFMQQALIARATMEVELRAAIEHSQLELFYQVQVNQHQSAIGAEALIRWNHPERGLVSPADFIPLAEETGQIKAMGAWVLATACQQLRCWQNQPLTAHLTLAVNVSAKQFKEAGFVEQVIAVIKKTGIAPQKLKIELTESTILDNVEEAIQKMRQLRELGVKFSLDDFGTGYSSLQYLKRLPLDQIKIDQSFVRDIADDPDDAVIVKTIIAMSNALGIEVIAEGVETKAQKHILKQKGCNFYQGYWFGKPCPINEFEDALG